jgi:hypothetical protein
MKIYSKKLSPESPETYIMNYRTKKKDGYTYGKVQAKALVPLPYVQSGRAVRSNSLPIGSTNLYSFELFHKIAIVPQS